MIDTEDYTADFAWMLLVVVVVLALALMGLGYCAGVKRGQGEARGRAPCAHQGDGVASRGADKNESYNAKLHWAFTGAKWLSSLAPTHLSLDTSQR